MLRKLDAGIAGARARLDVAHPTDWMVREKLAGGLLERARLTGHVDDYLDAQAVLDEALAMAPRGSGPLLLAARFNYAIHRLDEAELYLWTIGRQAIVNNETRVGARLLAAQIAMQRGEYADALAGFEEVARVSPAMARSELALYRAATGDAAGAEALFEQMLAEVKPKDAHGRAWTKLQLGIIAMHGGRYEQALSRLMDANKDLTGWWLVQEHIAEVQTLLGRDEEASLLYERVVRDTGLPQYQDALAGCYQRMHRDAEAKALVAKARVGWQEQLAELPESAMGHGLEHFLEHGSAEEALDLAKRNHETRPGGEAQVGLAHAYLKAGRPAEALAVVEGTLRTPYRTADLHDAARQAYEALGKTDEAQAEKAKCLALNPRFEP